MTYVEDVKNQIDLLKTLNNKSDHIINYFEDFSFYRIKHCIVIEYCQNGGLDRIIIRHKNVGKKIDDQKIQKWTLELLEGIDYLHKRALVHLKIEPSNILLDEKEKVKISGFSLAVDFDHLDCQLDKINTSERILFNLSYSSPEILNDEITRIDFKADIWSFGCTFFEMITTEKAFYDPKLFELHQKIVKGVYHIPDGINDNYREILEKSLIRDPKKRSTATQLREIMIEYMRIKQDDPFIGMSIDNDKIIIISLLGEGTFGRVYLADQIVSPRSKTKIAVKIMNAIGLKVEDFDELKNLNKIDCQYVIKCFGHFKNQFHLFIKLEYVKNRDLSILIADHEKVKSKIDHIRILKWTFETVTGLKELHSKSIIHRDIKPSNLFLTDDDHIKIGDFGFAKQIEKSVSSSISGTIEYMSPEMLNRERYTFTTDIWSLGCTVYELLFLKKAFPLITMERNANILHFEITILTSIVKKMLNAYFKERITSTQLYDHLEKMNKMIFDD